MTDINSSHDSDSASSGKGEIHKNQIHLYCMAGGEMPTRGYFGPEFWALNFGVEAQTIRNWINEYGIPFLGKSTKACKVRAEDMLDYLPRGNSDGKTK